ncbi:MAG: hypothetical protein K2I03_13360 [Lachnospiraceae bacterium]|nr:hypothetical protein [Lachnospiraceae bacterium]MDE6232801.1 hypothetical protein [Lachnospiraceae bacterium]MDE6252323.1 hypothetical protein [Lachnospiraceae bacterium]
MRKYNSKKIAAFLLMLAIATCSVFMPVQVQAAQKAYMKSVNVKWDLKKNKTITYKTKISGLGMRKMEAKISKYKIKNSKIKGYKELTFTVKFTCIPKLNGTQVHKCANSKESKKYNTVGGNSCYAIVDYNTGKSLMANNNMDIYVQSSSWVYSPKKYYYDSHGCWVSTRSYTRSVKVTYPKNYKGLCIGVCGSTAIKDTKNDDAFWNGKVAFGKTSYYDKKDKSVAHFMRVTK